MYRAAKLLSLMSTGFLAGVFTYAYFAIIPAWNEVSREVHFTYRVALMQHNAIVMQSIMLVGILAPLWWAWTIRAMPAARACAVAASIMNVTAVLVTRFGNVPINQLVRRWLTDPPRPQTTWSHCIAGLCSTTSEARRRCLVFFSF